MISFTRDELHNIQQNTPQNILPDFDYSDVLLNIVVGGAAALFRCYRMRSLLVKLRQRGLRTPLPSIHLANLHSLSNKTDKLLLLSRTNKDFFKLCCSVFHRNLAELRNTGQRAPSAKLPADQIRPRSRIKWGNRAPVGCAFTSMKGVVHINRWC